MVGVKAWTEIITIPTYETGNPEKNPLFLQNRVYQGSRGNVYPHPVIENLTDHKIEKQYTALYLENEYLKIMVLPELGGRVHMAVDKTNDYHFIYYNQVIKPALVGLTGPWIAGGIEFNWPQHHRPSTFEPLDWRIEENVDGSKTIWCSEIDQIHRMKGMHGLALYPGKSYLEVKVQLYNRTRLPQSFLWWANFALHANDQTQSVFPPDVNAVMDHGKREVINFPIANGKFYKIDYSPGIDITWFRNLPVPTSYMADQSEFNFLGHYDHGSQAGTLHVADHHIVPGKKQWTWGCGEFGKTWENQLTDEDGPYIELMCGAYSENQPDFSWLMPGEEKSFSQFFMPYKDIALPCNANENVAVRLSFSDNQAEIGVYVSSPRTVLIQVSHPNGIVYEKLTSLTPKKGFVDQVDIPNLYLAQDLTLLIFEEENILISYMPPGISTSAIPNPASVIDKPEKISTNEDLYLSGMHLMQYRHASVDPERYFQEAVNRDPYDSRCNNALGYLFLQQGRFDLAERYFKSAIRGLTRRNANPYDGESFYLLGLAFVLQEKFDEAYDAFYKCVWNAAFQDAGYFELARLASRKGNLKEALEFTRRAVRRNYFHHKARHLRIALFRRLGQTDAAIREASLALELDKMEFGAMWERYLLVQDTSFSQFTHQKPDTLIEIALDYSHAGLFLEAIALLRRAPIPDPMIGYFTGWFQYLDGDVESAKASFRSAAARPTDYCFPNRIECIPAFKKAVEINPDDSRAYYYLGNFYYAHRNFDNAFECWLSSRECDSSFPTVHRNLGIAYFNNQKEYQLALESYEHAFELDSSDARVLFELDQLYKKMNHPVQGRLIRLENYIHLVLQRDDLVLEYIKLLVLLGRMDEAYQHIADHKFHPWEGGEGKVSRYYVICMVELAKECLKREEFLQALDFLDKAGKFPQNLNESSLKVKPESEICYYTGIANESIGNQKLALKNYEDSLIKNVSFDLPQFYNDYPVENIFYHGLALRKLDREEECHKLFTDMIKFGEEHMEEPVNMDYFAVSLPDFSVLNLDYRQINHIHCNLLIGMGYLGLGKKPDAQVYIDRVLDLDVSHYSAAIFQKMCRE